MTNKKDALNRYLQGAKIGAVPGARYSYQEPGPQGQAPDSFKSLSASELYCPKCKRSMPVREKMLLVLSSGNVYDYVCARCGTTVGKKQG